MLVKGKKLRIDLCAALPQGHPDLVEVLPIHPGHINDYDLTDQQPKSIGIAPSLIDDRVAAYLDIMAQSVREKSVIAVGPVGMDLSLSQSHEQQLEILAEQLKIANTNNKPVILHIENAYREVIAIREKDKQQLPWIFLNFCHSDFVAGELFKMNGYFSFGKELFNPASKIAMCLDLFPTDRIFFDTSHCDTKNIDDMYNKATYMLEMDKQKLQQQIVKNFNAVFGDRMK
ncbi:MAG: hypothetical protein GVY19_12145 [Bacteroidetes bacterium]|jgi:TatD DNase family protein|nr:hypothetical protein [Bacteroidota bacterium]